MSLSLNVKTLCSQLREVEEQEPNFGEELNPYLMDTILPQLAQGKLIILKDINFDQFDEIDPPIIIEYMGWKRNLRRELTRINENIHKILPSYIKVRTFL